MTRLSSSSLRADRQFRVRKPTLTAVTVKHRRRWLKVLLRCLLLVGATVGAALLLHAGWGLMKSDSAFSVRRIQVVGLTHHDPVILRESLKDLRGRNLFLLSPEDVAEHFKGFPWLKGFLCRKHLPDTLIVEAQERPALCSVVTPEGVYELDGSGLSWPALEGVSGVLALGQGVNRDSAELQGLVAQLLSLSLAPQVLAVEKADGTGAYALVTRDGWRLIVSPRDIQTQWKRFDGTRAWAQAFVPGSRTMDIRWNGKVVLAPLPPQEEPVQPHGDDAPAAEGGGVAHG